ncbi:hypothetical protein NQ317_015337 [Molorchus minor]|uniref:Uncharacterized protein n=1 Tax=Molorchus minor TaxID=1323400 RepID=A0ABQ9JC79_9CUCU|nr:hypothetical protein NQ317_015337 [Molorchus minor]
MCPVNILAVWEAYNTASKNSVGEPTSSLPNVMGLVFRSITLHLPIDHTLRIGSAGVPLAPQVTTRTPLIKSPNDPQVINNQKLHWYSTSIASTPRSRFGAFTVVFCVATVRWSIGRLYE